MKEQKRCSARE